MDTTLTNRLAGQPSPYLLQHQHNPVPWQPWDAASLEAARTLDRPIFLSVGYATCYWCHVMERECFEVASVALELADRFVCIKVDREQQPDVDAVYMTATQLMTGRGGWPMSVFLTPDLEPIWCGTYLPAVPGRGLPSLGQVAVAIDTAWRERRGDCETQGAKVMAAVRSELSAQDVSGAAGPEDATRAGQALLRMVDAQWGGLGGAPKFPQASAVGLLLEMAQGGGEAAEEARRAVEVTLDQMGRGGVFDQVGGGFHRYSVDAHWRVPHFEKMLYDQGQLLSLYADYLAWRGDAREAVVGLARRVLRESAAYLVREMTDSNGAFWSAQDAEVEGREGLNYVWTAAEVVTTLGEEEAQGVRLADAAVVLMGLEGGPNFQDPHHADAPAVTVLHQPMSMEQAAGRVSEVTGQRVDAEALERVREVVRERLYAVRQTRKQPTTDDKVLSGWNGLAIKGLADAGRVLGEASYVAAAGRAAAAVLQHMRDGQAGGGLLRAWHNGSASIPGFLDDYADLAVGLLAVRRAEVELKLVGDDGEGSADWIAEAKVLMDHAERNFAARAGGYYAWRDGVLPVRGRPLEDGAVPGGNSQMVHAFLDAAALTGEASYRRRAAGVLYALGGAVVDRGAASPHLCRALLRYGEAVGEADGQTGVGRDPGGGSAGLGFDVGLGEVEGGGDGPRCGPGGCTT